MSINQVNYSTHDNDTYFIIIIIWWRKNVLSIQQGSNFQLIQLIVIFNLFLFIKKLQCKKKNVIRF